MKRTLEVCVDSLASAQAAIRGGANRLEVCSALAIGGLTPGAGLLSQLRQESRIEARCMIRPRAGDFLYAPQELELMAMEIGLLKAAGADGFVFGCLTADGDLDMEAMGALMEAAQGLPVTLHRAIDVSRDPEETYRRAAKLGVASVLTSGAAASCTAGAETIGRLLAIQQSIDGPELIIGAGVSAPVMEALLDRFPTASAFHMSGKVELESRMRFRRAGVPMGIPGLDEWHIQQTDQAAIAAARQVLDR